MYNQHWIVDSSGSAFSANLMFLIGCLQTSGSSSLPEMSRWPSSVEPSSQSMPSSQVSVTGPGIIGRRSAADLGAIGDNLINTAANDQLYNLQMLDAAFHKIPLPKDSELLRSYTPVWKYDMICLHYVIKLHSTFTNLVVNHCKT
jgi:hypothetical protein